MTYNRLTAENVGYHACGAVPFVQRGHMFDRLNFLVSGS
jgi:hypothetical protein